ncbi:DUF4334 domain-containing protein [Streptomyces sp. NPDC048197]|uniref:DUF4334 domain-containing protein n=1 Tax=Streptomyces sp. NPDC048197 TaxID=3365511 RepID=UPI0037114E7B
MDIEQARARIADIRAAGERVTADELDQLWAVLETVRPEEILGSWQGSAFLTGHHVEDMLEQAKWHGKRFHSASEVQPLICRDDNGELFSHTELGNGEASLWMVEFRGESTATMVYDGRPILDHFKRVDDDTLMGVMNGRGVMDSQGHHFYFVLEREPS